MAVYNFYYPARKQEDSSTAHVWGVCWNYADPSTMLVRLNPGTDPYEFTTETVGGEPVAAIGDGSGSSHFDSVLPWAGMEEYNIIDSAVVCKRGEEGFSRSEYDTMVYIPEFWYAVRDDVEGQKRYWYISDGRRKNFLRHPGSGRYVGRYICGDGYVSKSGLAPASCSLEAAIGGTRERGDGWYIYDYKTYCAIALLYLVEFADWDSQAKLGDGFLANPSCSAGDTDVMSYHTGHVSGEKNKEAMQYRHIENLFGGAREFIGGLLEYDKAVYISENPNIYGITQAGYAPAGCSTPAGWGFIKALHFSERFPWAFLPKTLDNSHYSSIYVPDFVWDDPGSNGIRTITLSGIPGETGYRLRNGLFSAAYDREPASVYSTRNVFDPALIAEI